MDELVARGEMSVKARVELAKVWSLRIGEKPKTEEEVENLRHLVFCSEGIDHARNLARRFHRVMVEMLETLSVSDHRQFLSDLARFVIERQY